MAALWKGSISFGLVNIPVQLFPAVRPGEGAVHFRQLRKKDLAPIRYERVSTADDAVVPWSDIVKGYEYAKNKFVVLTPAELKAAAPEASKTIDILDFVKEASIDPRYFDTPYYFRPDRNGDKAYALLRDAIRESGLVGIAKFTLRQKEHLAGIKPMGDALMLEMMRFAHELVDVSDVDFPTAQRAKVTPQEMRMARQLIESLAAEWKPEKYTDDHYRHLTAMIQAKLKGKKITPAHEATAAEPKVLDLMSKLRESLDQRPKSKANGPSARALDKASARASARTKRAPRKPAARRSA
jgi:DNA end-binding protein Ku